MKLKSQGNYCNGKKCGNFTEYNEEGIKEYEGEMLNDNYHGKGTLFDFEGNIKFEGV